MEADNICARQLEAQKVVDYELVKRLQQISIRALLAEGDGKVEQ